MATVNVYLQFEGNCEEAFNFYKKVFGGEFSYIARYTDMPAQEDVPPVREEDKNKILHISLPLSEETSIMGSDHLESWGAPLVTGNNFSLSVDVDSRQEADRIFNELSKDGNVTMHMDKTFWGAYFGSFTDKFGINWMVSSEIEE